MRSAGSLVLLATVAFAACDTAGGGDGGEPDVVRSQSDVCGGITYESFAGPFFLSWCTGCHSSNLPEGERQTAPLGVDFDTKAGVESRIDAILARVHERTMPPAGGPSDTERDLLAEWVGCGMPGEGAYYDPPLPQAGSNDPPPDTRECAAVRQPLPAAILPRCASSTRACRAACANGEAEEDAISACRDACLKSDPTPPAAIAGYPVSCESCNLLQLLACAESVDCGDQVAALMCCFDECKANPDPACGESKCKGEIDAFGQCVYYRGEHCLKDDNPDFLGACYGAFP